MSALSMVTETVSNAVSKATDAAIEAQQKFSETVEAVKADMGLGAPDASLAAANTSVPQSPASVSAATPTPPAPAVVSSLGGGAATPQARTYEGPVKVDNEIAPFVEQKNFIEAGIVEVSGVKYKPDGGWLTEFKGVGTATESRLQAGYKLRVGEELVSAPNRLEFVSGTLNWFDDTFGITKASLTISTGYKSEDHVASSAISWKKGPKSELNEKSEKFFTKVSLSTEGELYNQPVEFSTEAEIKSERKTPYEGQPGAFKSKWDATPIKTKIVSTNFNQESSSDPRVTTGGELIDRKTPEGEVAYQDGRFVSTVLPDNGLNFHMQKEVGGASNLALNVPSFEYRGQGGGSIDETLRAANWGWFGLGQSDAIVTRSVDSPEKISNIEIDGKSYVPVEAVAEWLQYQGTVNPEAYGDLRRITPDILIEHNQGRVKAITLEDAQGVRSDVEVFDEGDVVNTGYATVQDLAGVIRAPNLENGASQAKFELFWDQVTISVADNIEPGAVSADGSIDRARLTSKIAAYGFGSLVDTAAQAPLGLAEGATRFIGGITAAGNNTGIGWLTQPTSWALGKTADGIGWTNDRVGDAVGHFTDQPRMAHDYVFIKQPTDQVLAPAAQERYERLEDLARQENWSEQRLQRESEKLLNQYHHQALEALESGRIPTAWDDNAPQSAIPDLDARYKAAMTE